MCGGGDGDPHTRCLQGGSGTQGSFARGCLETQALQETQFSFQAVEPRRSKGSLYSCVRSGAENARLPSCQEVYVAKGRSGEPQRVFLPLWLPCA